MQLIQVFAEAGITGFESPATEYKQLGLSLDQLLINKPTATFLAIASGRSMEGVGIYDGDLLIIDRSVQPNHRDIIVASFNGSFVCKIIDLHNSLLISASELHSSVKINECDDLHVEGVVTRSIRLHKPAPELLSCTHS